MQLRMTFFYILYQKLYKILVYSARKNITTNLCADMDNSNNI